MSVTRSTDARTGAAMTATPTTFATEYEPADAEHGADPVFERAASREAAVRRARKLSGKEAPFGPTVYVLAMRGDERVGQIVYVNGVRDSADGELA